MQKLIETLKSFGIEIPADKQADVKKALSEHYKNAAEHNKAISKLEADRDAWKEKAESAEETLKGFEGIDPAQVQSQLAEYKKKAEDAEKDRDAKLYERDFADALKTELEGVKFTSEAAKKSVMADIKEAGLKMKDGKILGLNDLISQMKEKDASAFVDEKQEQLEAERAKPFTGPLNQNTGGQKMTKSDILNIKDAGQRQSAIAQNLGLFGKGE
jgi:RNA polymerase-interacting CarD/CdnL/TRCF family regulator